MQGCTERYTSLLLCLNYFQCVLPSSSLDKQVIEQKLCVRCHARCWGRDESVFVLKRKDGRTEGRKDMWNLFPCLTIGLNEFGLDPASCYLGAILQYRIARGLPDLDLLFAQPLGLQAGSGYSRSLEILPYCYVVRARELVLRRCSCQRAHTTHAIISP